ncbi:MAG: hypothetical protein ACRDS9_09355 [Pseudonocardiaceae bacterium]
MRRGWRVELAKTCGYALGVGNLALLLVLAEQWVLAEHTIVTLSLAVVLAPFTLALSLKLTAFLACGFVSLALGDPRERAELLVYAIAGLQPPSAGEKYREAMHAEISVAPSDQVRAIRINLIQTTATTVLAAWAQFFRGLWRRARPQRVFRAQRPTAGTRAA